MSSVSQILRHTREVKGITLDDVAQRTYIKLPYLVALEDGHIEDLLAPVFVHGYIRQYARLLGLNAAELVQQYQGEVKRDHPKLAPAPVLSTADAEVARIPVYAMAGDADSRGNGSSNGLGNGHASSRIYNDAEPALPLASEVTYVVERKVPMERPEPQPVPLENGRIVPAVTTPEVASAQAEAQRILAEAQIDADRLRKDAEKYAHQVLVDLEAELARALGIIKNGRQFLQQRRRHTISTGSEK